MKRRSFIFGAIALCTLLPLGARAQDTRRAPPLDDGGRDLAWRAAQLVCP